MAQITRAEAQNHILQEYKSRINNEMWTSFVKNIANFGSGLLSGRFLNEILQNTDDAGGKTIEFELKKRTFTIIHNGRHFDKNDIDKIISFADQNNRDKSLSNSMTGFKGIGFKALLSMAKRVDILSNPYTIKFDKEHPWQRDVPWEFIPIWLEDAHPPSKVTFVFELKDNETEQMVRQELSAFKAAPLSLLFLRNLTNVAIKIDQIIFEILLNKTPTELSLDTPTTNQSWVIQKSPLIPIPDIVRQSVQSINTVLCPDRIKNARTVQITFGYRKEESQLVVSEFLSVVDLEIFQPQLYSTLPIKDRAGLPFVVNAEWILDMQRDHMTSDDWNAFLLEKLGYFQFSALRALAEKGFWKDVLTVIGNPHILLGEFKLLNAYQRGYEQAIREIGWIPARGNPTLLLKLSDCFIDPTGFLEQFENDFPNGVIIPQLAHPELNNLGRLQALMHRYSRNVIDQQAILKYISEMFQHQFDPKLCYRILKFMISDQSLFLYQDAWIPCGIGKLALLNELYLVGSEIDLPPLCIKICCLSPKVLQYDTSGEITRWFKEMRVQLLTPQLIVDEIAKKVSIFSDQESRAVLDYLFKIFISSKISKDDLQKLRHLKVQTASGSFAQAGTLFLSKEYVPHNAPSLEEIFPSKPSFFLSSIYLGQGGRQEEWVEFFLACGVKEKCSLERYDQLPIAQLVEDIDWAPEFYYFLNGLWPRTQNTHQPQTAKSVVLIPKISELKTNSKYAQMFWKLLTEQEKSFIANDQKFAIGAPFAKNVSVQSYIRWVLTTQKVIRSTSGSYENVQDLYSPTYHFVHRFGLPIAAIDVPLSDELTEYLGFKTTLKLAQCFDCLKEMRDQNIKDINLYNRIIDNVVKGLGSSESSHRWFFLAQDNSWQSARLLKYLGARATPLKEHGYRWFKNTAPAIEELAKQLGRPIVTTIVDPDLLQNSQEDTALSGEIQRTKLPLLALVLHQQTMSPLQSCFQSLQDKFKGIHLFEVAKIPTINNDFMSPDIAISGSNIYYTKKVFRHHIWQEIIQILIPDSHNASTFIDILSLAQDGAGARHKTIHEWLDEQHLNPELSAQLREIQAATSTPKRPAPPLTQHQPPAKKQSTQGPISVDEDDDPEEDVQLDAPPSPASNRSFLIETLATRPSTSRTSTSTHSAPIARTLGHRLSSEEKNLIGRTGEKHAFESLVGHYETKYGVNAEHICEGVAQVITPEKKISIRWINEESETLSPYDIEVHKQQADLPSVQKFIEVKSTRGEEPAFFMSEAEMNFLKRNKSDYRLYMVFNAQTPDPLVKKIDKNWIDNAKIHERKKFKITLKENR